MQLTWKKVEEVWEANLPNFQFIIESKPLERVFVLEGYPDVVLNNTVYFLKVNYEGSPIEYPDRVKINQSFLEVPCDRRIEKMFDEYEANLKVKEILNMIVSDIFEAISFPCY